MKTDYATLEIAFEDFCDQFMLDAINNQSSNSDYLVEFVSTMAQYLLDRDDPQMEMVIDEYALAAKDREFKTAAQRPAAKKKAKPKKARKKVKRYGPVRLPKEWGQVR